jgi:hypothetical protein
MILVHEELLVQIGSAAVQFVEGGFPSLLRDSLLFLSFSFSIFLRLVLNRTLDLPPHEF